MGYRLYVGSVACDTSHEVAKKYAYGLTAFEFNRDCTDARGCVVYGQCLNPGFLAVSNGCLYAGCEFTDRAYFNAYRIDKGDGCLHFLNCMEIPGAGLCQINVKENRIFGAEFWAGSLVSCTLSGDGSIQEVKSFIPHTGSSIRLPRQESAHVHSVYSDPSGRHLVACDLGMDKLVIYRIEDDGTLIPNTDCEYVKAPAGSGPRHFAFHPGGRYAYLITEMTDEIITYSYDPQKGVLQEIGRISGLPDDFSGETMAADINVSADGLFLYTSHRKSNIISVYSIDPENGLPTRISGYDSFGEGPRSFSLSPDGTKMAIANREENLVVICEIDRKNGALGKKLWQSVVMEPCCVVWDKF